MSKRVPYHTSLSRADLLALLDTKDTAAINYLAGALGFLPEKTKNTKGSKRSQEDDNDQKQPVLKPEKDKEHRLYTDGLEPDIKPESVFWVLKEREVTQQKEPHLTEDTGNWVGWRKRPASKPAFYPLVSPKDFLPRLFKHLEGQSIGNELDLKELIRKLERGEYLYRIPYKSQRSLGRHLHIIQDHHQHLVPYWIDQALYAGLLESCLPDYACSHDVLVDGQSQDWVLPPEKSLVLIFSDLGGLSLQPETQITGWLELGKRICRRGCKVVVVVPCHPGICDPRLRALFSVIPWQPLRQLTKLTQTTRQQQASQLLTLSAPAVRLEPGLLRRIRLALLKHGYAFDASIEAAVWQHPEMTEPSSVAATFNAEARVRWLEAFAEAEFTDDAVKQTILECIREWRASLSEQVWFEEITSLDTDSRSLVRQEDLQDARQYFQQLSATDDAGEQAVFENRANRQWFKRMERRLPQESWELSGIAGALQQIAAQVHKNDKHYHTNYPIDPANLRASHRVETQVGLYQYGNTLTMGRPIISELQSGSSLSEIRVRRGLLYYEFTTLDYPVGSHKSTVRQSLQFQTDFLQTVKLCDLPEASGLMIRSDMETLEFQAVVKPDWADSIARDTRGLYIEHGCLGKLFRSYWQDPQGKWAGFWEGFPFNTIAFDDYGLYAELSIHNNVTQRFRWIEPGTFMMGSLESEEGRWDDEDLHQVTLTQGYWLADTTVTQALWEAVTGQNPSRFKGMQRPVEQVSWEDCQQFIEKLNELIPGLQAQLPTEAQWEYACRAGTTAPFYFGDKEDLSLERVNYSGQWDEDDSDGETKPVKSYPPNDQGLYEMHGNVWEWCQDVWQEHLGTERVVDPQRQAESEQAEAKRVVRGGSWFDWGRGCRSAFRGRYVPDVRGSFLGFRLSLARISHQSKK